VPPLRWSRLGRPGGAEAPRRRKSKLGASFVRFRALLGVELHQGFENRVVKAFARVRCLDCGSSYSKPMGRGTAAANPGCPTCGYLGWVPFSGEEAPPQHRFDADLLPLRFARRR
jgi:hypothetical protein